MKCVVYMRCSGDGQITGDTWDRQQEACYKYAAVQSLDIVAEFRDEGVTGKMELEGRSGLSACMEYIREHKIQIVLVESSDRLARDMIVAEVIIREFQKIGVKVIAASGGLDLTEGSDANPTAKLIRQILAAISEWERCVITLKLRGARQRKKAREGKCEGRKGFGELPEEAQTLEEIWTLWHGMQYNCKQVAKTLNDRGRPTRSGKPWRPSVVAKIVVRLRLQKNAV